MTNLARRLRKLEAGIVDSHGLIRFSPRWWEYWNEEFERMQTGEDVDLTGLTLADIGGAVNEGGRQAPRPT